MDDVFGDCVAAYHGSVRADNYVERGSLHPLKPTEKAFASCIVACNPNSLTSSPDPGISHGGYHAILVGSTRVRISDSEFSPSTFGGEGGRLSEECYP